MNIHLPKPDFNDVADDAAEPGPIISAHWFGRNPEAVRRARLVRHLHRLGERPILELLNELDRAHDIGIDLDRRLEQYGRLNPGIVEAIGGRDLAERRLLEVMK